MCGLCRDTKWIIGRVESVRYAPADPWGVTTNDVVSNDWCEGRVPCPACKPEHHGIVTKIEIKRTT